MADGTAGGAPSVLDAVFKVINPSPGAGDFTTMQAAINAGFRNLVVQGAFTPALSTLLPDADMYIEFAAGCSIAPTAGVPIFKVPNILTALRYFHFDKCPIQGDGVTAGQNLIEIADTHGFANVTFHDPNITGLDTLVNFTGYDLTYTFSHNVLFRGGRCFPRGSTSTLCKTFNPAGTYAGFVAVTVDNTRLGNDALSVSGQLWFINLDGDVNIYCGDDLPLGIKDGSGYGGGILEAEFIYIGNGDVMNFGVNGSGGSRIRSEGVFGTGVNSRIITNEVGIEVSGFMASCALKFTSSLNSVRNISFTDSRGLSNPGIEFSPGHAGDEGFVIADTLFGGFNTGNGVFPNGCVKITGGKRCKVHDCDFLSVITGHTVTESGASNQNIFHDNTGYQNGTGPVIVGVGTIEHDNIP